MLDVPAATWSHLLFSISFLFSMIPNSKSDDATYLYHFCSNDTLFATKSKYEANLNSLFRSLSSNATASSNSGFYATVSGNGTWDAVFGLFLCRGDQNATTCRDCVASATGSDLPKTYCANRKVAVIWYDMCMVRYSSQSFFGKMDEIPKVFMSNVQNINGNKTQFTDLVGKTMNDVAVGASNGDKSGRKFRTEQANFTSLETLYAMAQCTPDLTSSDCNKCLRIAIGQLSIMEGARVLQPSCNVRYETYPFYNGETADLSPPSTQCIGSTNPNYENISCSKTSFAGNSRYQANLKVVLHYLTLNASSNPSGFGYTVEGEGTSDVVYGLFLCRGDQNVSKCHECVATAISSNFSKYDCSNRTEAIVLYDECMVRYSNESLVNKVSLSQEKLRLSVTDQNIGNDSQLFDETLFKLIPDVINEAANKDTSGKKKFATTETNINSVLNIYLMAQCTPDLSSSDCSMCLGAAANPIFSSPTDGAQVFLTSCTIRYETCQFLVPIPQEISPSGTHTGSKKRHWLRNSLLIIIAISISAGILLVVSLLICKRKKNTPGSCNFEMNEIKTAESLKFELNTIRVATGNFSLHNKLGEGGFGEVYKGILEDGQEVAIKRLSKNSAQGIEEFKTEVVLVANLQHKNLVKLLGFCLALNEKLLIYEFMKHASLDRLLFDEEKKMSLDWRLRYKIIIGIARGLLYLHEDSRLTIIHRDLKPSNILLDEAMNPKISDFGLAKLFEAEQTQGDTKRIVGTYGYMAPEYAMTGHFSVKSDVYSFGIIILEIVSGQKNKFFGHSRQEEALLHRAWRLWNERKPLELLDLALSGSYQKEEATKCIHIGLLCIQEKAGERPRMASVVAALDGHSISLPLPKPPHCLGDTSKSEDISSAHYDQLIDGDKIEYRPIVNQQGCSNIYTGSGNITDLCPR